MLKGFSTWGERGTIFLCWLFHLLPTTRDTRCKASVSKRKSTFSSEAGTQLTIFSNPQNPPRTLPLRDVIHLPLSGISILTSLNDTYPARAWTPALMLHITNPCAKQKVLSLTKPKGKIYKTKSLGHYPTILREKLLNGKLLNAGLLYNFILNSSEISE